MFRASIATAAVLAFTCALPAESGVFTDDFSRCLASKATPDDKLALMKWMVFSFAQSPAVSDTVSSKADRIAVINQQVGQTFQRLLTVTCRSEVVAALKNEGTATLEAGFGVLGQVAAVELSRDAKVSAAMEGFASGLDESKLKELFKEAGLKTEEAATKTK